MAKAKPEAITWIRYSQAKALASEYLGDPDFVGREIRKMFGGWRDSVAVRTL